MCARAHTHAHTTNYRVHVYSASSCCTICWLLQVTVRYRRQSSATCPGGRNGGAWVPSGVVCVWLRVLWSSMAHTCSVTTMALPGTLYHNNMFLCKSYKCIHCTYMLHMDTCMHMYTCPLMRNTCILACSFVLS